MTNKKSTKRALLLSALSLLLCVSMLVGSTFAWFTDSVTSGNNIIKSGNLDVELEYKKVDNGVVSTEWASVKDKTDIFNPKALWEPGHVEVVYLKVSNLGTLALKYQLGVNVIKETLGKTETGADIKLSEHLVFKVVEMPNALTTYTDREAVKLAAGTEKGLTDYNGKTTALDAKGGANAEDYVALIVYMPETVGNEANYSGDAIPTIELGINLYATQYTAEEDSFDEFYDKNAWVKGFKVYSANELQGAINAGESAITLMDNIEVTEPVNIPADATVALNLNGKTLSSATNMVIYNEGTLTLSGRGTVESAGQAYAIRVQKGKAIIDSVDINVKGAFGAVSIFNGADVTINGGNYSAAGIAGKTSHTIYMGGYGTLNINGGTFYRDGGGDSGGVIVGYGWENEANKKAVININGGTINSAAAWGWISNYDGAWTTISATGGVFGRNPSAIVANGYKAVENNGVYYVVPDGVSNVVTTAAQLQAALDAATGNATIVLAADINGDVTVNQKEGVNIVIDGKNYKYDGVITIDGKARHTGTETLNIKSVNFETAKDNVDFISSNIAKQYAHNVTIEDCTFTNKGEGTVVPARFRQAYNITMKNCTVEGTFSPLWATGVKGLTIDNVIANCKNEGINVGASDNVLIENCKITVAAANGFGIRTDATAGYKMTVNNCELNAAKSIVIRNAVDTYTVTVDGVPLVGTSTGLKDAIATGATNVSVAQDMTITGATLSSAANDLTVDLAADTTVTVASGAATSKDLTFTGDKSSKVVLVNTTPGGEGALSYQDGANLTFKGITFDANQISGICARGGVVTFIDCFITGELEKTIASKFVFSGCTFDVGVTQVGYGCSDVVFEDCDFETDGYGIKIYSEGQTPVNLTVKGCSFKNTGSAARSAILLDHIINGISYNITVENCNFEGYTATPTPTYNKWAERMIVTDSFVKTADGQYIFSYQTGIESGSYHKPLTSDKLVVTVK